MTDWTQLPLDDLLTYGAEHGIIETVLAALNSGANVHYKNEQALRAAAHYGHTKIVNLLLSRGADVHAKDDEALYSAVLNNDIDTIRLLMMYGAALTGRILDVAEENPKILAVLMQ